MANGDRADVWDSVFSDESRVFFVDCDHLGRAETNIEVPGIICRLEAGGLYLCLDI